MFAESVWPQCGKTCSARGCLPGPQSSIAAVLYVGILTCLPRAWEGSGSLAYVPFQATVDSVWTLARKVDKVWELQCLLVSRPEQSNHDDAHEACAGASSFLALC